VAAALDYDQTFIGIEDQCLAIREFILLAKLRIDEKLHTPGVVVVFAARYQCIQGTGSFRSVAG